MTTSFLFLSLCLQFLRLDLIHGTNTGYLALKRTDQGKVKGCWEDKDPVFLMCFHISDRRMIITHGGNRRMLVLYQTNKEKNIHYIQVLGVGLLRYKAMEIGVPMLVSNSLARKMIKRKIKELTLGSKVPSGLNQFIKEVQKSSKHRVLLKTTGRKLLTVNEADTLGKISSALTEHSLSSRLQKPVEQFQLLCLGLIRSVGPFEASTVVSHDCHNQIPLSKISSTHHRRPGYDVNILTNQKWTSLGCEDMRNGSDPQCFGMCGKICWCWDWVCGDCCLHKGCLQHDACCRYTSPQYLSTYCLLPFIYGFDCSNGYNGYPECLHN